MDLNLKTPVLKFDDEIDRVDGRVAVEAAQPLRDESGLEQTG